MCATQTYGAGIDSIADCCRHLCLTDSLRHLCTRAPISTALADWVSENWQTLDHTSFTTAVDDVPLLLESAQKTFGGKMAYIVIQRAGEARLYPLGLPVMWHLVWAVAEWSGLRNGFTSKAHAVVIRTRPDVIFTVPFSLRPLQHYFARGAHGAPPIHR